MTWSDFYLFCFFVGFLVSVLSFLSGAGQLHLPFHLHLPSHGHHSGGIGARGLAGRGMAGKGIAGKGSAHGTGGISWFNAMTAMTFLAWFGGVGYILATHSKFVAVVALLIAAGSGLFAAAAVFKFMSKVARVSDAQMLEWDYRVEGAVGTVSSPIREGGVGEVIFEQQGTRKSLAARSEDRQTIPTGTEVAVTRYEGGIAYVKRWEEYTK
jgi:membrane protein implicated in regulation of membrane protease activity